ncbi:MAG: hypothetical protein U0269_31520 [Polyangiales bacterium]
MKTPSALRLRSIVQPRGLWPDGRVIDQWMDAGRTHCFALFDTGWVVSIDVRSGAHRCSRLLDVFANDPILYGTFFGDDRCKLFGVTNKWQRYLFELDPETPPRLAHRSLIETSGGVSMRASLSFVGAADSLPFTPIQTPAAHCSR